MRINISVVIPTYNRKDELIRAVQSVLAQTFMPIEIIVVDDHSNFDVEDLLIDRFNNKLIKVHVNPDNVGAAKSRNIGVKKSTGEYIAFLDSDDYWLEKKLEKQAKIIMNHLELDLIYTDQLLENNTMMLSSNKKLINADLSQALIAGWTAPNTSTLMMKKSSFLSIDGFDECLKSCQDHDLWFKIAKKGMLVDYVSEPLSVFVIDSSIRISFNLDGVFCFLSKWKDYIVSIENANAYSAFKNSYIYKTSYPIFAYNIKRYNLFAALYVYVKYLAVNKSFYYCVVGKLFFKK